MVVTETLIENFEETIPQACKEDGNTPNRARYVTTSEIFLQPRYIPNSKGEDLSVGGRLDSIQKSSSECVPVVNCLFQGTGTSVHDRVLCD